MNKNIVIQEGGIGKLKTQDGGTEDWVSADEKKLVVLQIGGSGTYKAGETIARQND